MYEIFGIQIPTREERKQKEKALLDAVFPGGEAERTEVQNAIAKRFRKRDREVMMYLYITIRQRQLEKNCDFDEALAGCSVMKHITLSEQDKAALKELLRREEP